MEKLKVLARGSSCFPDPHGTERTPQVRSILGKEHKQVSPGQWAWVSKDKPSEVAYHHDIVKAVRDGDLWAADEATAKAAGVKFDPTFGGEYAKAAEPKDQGKKQQQPDKAGGKGDV